MDVQPRNNNCCRLGSGMGVAIEAWKVSHSANSEDDSALSYAMSFPRTRSPKRWISVSHLQPQDLCSRTRSKSKVIVLCVSQTAIC